MLKYSRAYRSQDGRVEEWGQGEGGSAPTRVVGALGVQTSWPVQCGGCFAKGMGQRKRE